MRLTIPRNFVKIDAEHFWYLLGNIDWQRDAYCGGEYFNAKGWEKPFEQKYVGGARTEMEPRCVGVHTTADNYYIDPTFFPLALEQHR